MPVMSARGISEVLRIESRWERVVRTGGEPASVYRSNVGWECEEPHRAPTQWLGSMLVATTVFITRKFPPAVGGMETLANDVWSALRTRAGDSVLAAYGGPVPGTLRWWFRSRRTFARLMRDPDVEVVIAGDVVMFVLLRRMARRAGVHLISMAMGKDIVWSNPLYQRVIRRQLRGAEGVIAISRATASAAIAAGVDGQRVRALTLGVELPPERARSEATRALRARWDIAEGQAVLVTLGRLVRRKGVAWFIREVMDELPENVVLLVAGEGSDRRSIEDAVSSSHSRHRIRLLGAVSDEDRELLMAGADLFIQPNIPVQGDMEGFGLVTVEAAVRGTMVIAADLEGRADAVEDERTGFLVPPGDVRAWVSMIKLQLSGHQAREARAREFQARARKLYSREAMGARLDAMIRELLALSGHP